MKKLIRSLTAGQILLFLSSLLSLLILAILSVIIRGMCQSQLSQQMAGRWSREKDVSQVSCFFSANTEVDPDFIESFRHSLDAALQEASIEQESENVGARLWADAYSADGQITLQNGSKKIEADAIGIGGDFFLFHPERLLFGSYFSGNDLMQDYCVIDEDVAWQLFGSSDVAGMTVSINNIPHVITGVMQREQGSLYEAAGLDGAMVYVSYETLVTLGSSNGINHYEIVMPNPVRGYAYGYVEEALGDEREVEVIENTTRYQLLKRLQVIASFGKRSMNGKAIIYPYWENVARGYEDIVGLLTLFSLLFFLYPVLLYLILFIKWWRHKGWTIRSAALSAKDKAERFVEDLREKRKMGGKHSMDEEQSEDEI